MIALWREAVGLLPFEWAQFEFMRHALLAVLLAAPLFALAGTLVVGKRLAFFSDAIGHSVLTGLGVGAVLGLAEPAWAMVLFAAAVAAGIAWVQALTRAPSDTVIGVFLALVVALGIVLLSRGGGFARYTGYLIGDLLAITPGMLAWMAPASLVAGAVLALAYNRLLLVSLNPGLALSRGQPVLALQVGFALGVAVVVTLNVQWVGILVISALLVVPAAAARNVARSTAGTAAWAVAIALAAGVSGLIASYHWSTATGATIVLFTVLAFALTAAGGALARRAQR